MRKKKTNSQHLYDVYTLACYPKLLWVATAWDDKLRDIFHLPDDTPIEPPDGNAATYMVNYTESKRGGFLILFDRESISVDDWLGIVAHEALHVTMDLFDFIGAPTSDDNQEPMAYLIEWIANCCWETIRKTVTFKPGE